MVALYNEIDPFKAEWLRELIKRGLIAPGEVWTRSIEDITPVELVRFTQFHTFAGIGIWSYAARRAGWPDERPLWTGSCPCQPFSSAGKGEGFDDERHLWPAWHWLISQQRPDAVLGEQVADRDGLNWLDLVSADMEGTDYTGGAVDLCSAGVGASDRRQRLYLAWLADAERGGRGELGNAAFPSSSRHDDGSLEPDRLADPARQRHEGAERGSDIGAGAEHSDRGTVDGLGDAGRHRDRQHARELPGDESEYEVGAEEGDHPPIGAGTAHGLADAPGPGSQGGTPGRPARSRSKGSAVERTRQADGLADPDLAGRGAGGLSIRQGGQDATEGIEPGSSEAQRLADAAGPGRGSERGRGGDRTGDAGSHLDQHLQGDWASPLKGFWRDADWLHCRDEKWRPVRPGSFPLVDGAPARMGRLRGYGEGINAEVATTFIKEVIAEMKALGRW